MNKQYYSINNLYCDDLLSIYRVIHDLKPACSSSFNVLDSNLIRADYDNYYYYSKRLPLKYFFDEDEISNFDLNEIIIQRAIKLYNSLKDEFPAIVLVKLAMVPKKDDLFPHACVNNASRPEISLLEGLIFGYPPENVEWYVKRQLNSQKFILFC